MDAPASLPPAGPAPPPAKPRRFTRRRILKAAAGTLALGALGAGGYFASRDRLRIGIVGCGVRGRTLAEILRKGSYYLWRHGSVVAVADVFLPKAHALAAAQCPANEAAYQDFRQLLKHPDLDAVVVATPNHTHAAVSAAALRAGKAVYHEKPFAHTLAESRRLAAEVKATGRPFLVGTQQRNTWFCRTGCELARAGRMGAIRKTTVVLRHVPKPAAADDLAPAPVPDGLDWDGWLGPAAAAPYSENRYKRFHNFYAYGCGDLLNWGPHQMDIALWALDLQNTLPTRVETAVAARYEYPPGGYEVPYDFTARFEFPGGKVVHMETTAEKTSGVRIEAERGTMWIEREQVTGPAADELAANPLPESALIRPDCPAPKTLTTLKHLSHFFDVVRGRAEPVSDAASSHPADAALQLAAISFRVGRPVAYDAAAGTIPNDPEATALIDPPRRSGYEV